MDHVQRPRKVNKVKRRAIRTRLHRPKSTTGITLDDKMKYMINFTTLILPPQNIPTKFLFPFSSWRPETIPQGSQFCPGIFFLTFPELGQNAHFPWLEKVSSNVQVFQTQWEYPDSTSTCLLCQLRCKPWNWFEVSRKQCSNRNDFHHSGDYNNWLSATKGVSDELARKTTKRTRKDTENWRKHIDEYSEYLHTLTQQANCLVSLSFAFFSYPDAM